MPKTVRSVLLLLCLSGCSSAEPTSSGGDLPISTTSELTIVVWSSHLQREVPATGAVISTDNASRQEAFDSRSSPTRGNTLTLRPGQYQIAVRFRYLATGVQRVDGEEVVYLEPGAKTTVRVVVSDQKEDIGSRPAAPTQPISPAVETPPLPLESRPG